MSLSTTISFDATAKTGTYLINVGGIPVTNYTLSSDGNITLSATSSNQVVTVAYFKDALKNVDNFIKIITKSINYPYCRVSKHKEQITTTSNKVKMKLNFGKDVVADYHWAENTGLITLKKRDEITISWEDFKHWVEVSKHFIAHTN